MPTDIDRVGPHPGISVGEGQAPTCKKGALTLYSDHRAPKKFQCMSATAEGFSITAPMQIPILNGFCGTLLECSMSVTVTVGVNESYTHWLSLSVKSTVTKIGGCTGVGVSVNTIKLSWNA